MGSGSQLLAPQVRAAKGANIKPDLKTTEIRVCGAGAGLPGEMVLPALSGRDGPAKTTQQGSGFWESRRCPDGPSGLALGKGLPAARRGPELAPARRCPRGERPRPGSSSAPAGQRRPGAPPAGSLPRVGRAADASGGSFNFNVERCFSSFRSKFPLAAAASAGPSV